MYIACTLSTISSFIHTGAREREREREERKKKNTKVI
jgi:hypothetical protein